MNISKRNLFVFVLSFFSVFLFSYTSSANAQHSVGYRSLSTWEQKENIRIDVSIWYPTMRAVSEFRLADFIVSAAKNAPILRIVDEEIASPFRIKREIIRKQARKEDKTQWEINQEVNKVPLPHKKLPFILLSHDSGATRYSNHTLAFALASRGFIVAMPNHVGDNAFRMPHLDYGRTFSERARQISTTLDFLLSDETLFHYIDDSNMTYLGFGGGGTSGLLLTGTNLSVDLWDDYCTEFNDITQNMSYRGLSSLGYLGGNLYKQKLNGLNADINPYCVDPIRSQMDSLVRSLEEISTYDYIANMSYGNVNKARKKQSEKTDEIVNKFVSATKKRNSLLVDFIGTPPLIQPYFPPYEPESQLRDNRFARMIFVSPGYSFLFEREGLSHISKPTLFIGLEQDSINMPQYQSEILFKNVDNKYATHIEIAGTDIWGLQAPCIEANMLVEICKSVSDEKRTELTKQLSKIIVDFVKLDEEN